MKRFLKTKSILFGLSALLVCATLAYAITVSIRPGGIAFPYWYSYTAGVKSTYYLTHPTLTANEAVVSLTATQTMTNKTLTSPILNSRLNTAGYIISSSGTSVPTATTAGYAPGSVFILDDATLGKAPLWMNAGTAASCSFYPYGPTMGYGCAYAGGPISLEDAADETYVSLPGILRSTDYCFAQHAITDAADQFNTIVPASEDRLLINMAMGGNPTDSMDANFAAFRSNCTPTYDIFAAGTRGCLAADDDTIAITIAGLLATDIAIVTQERQTATQTIDLVVCTAGTLTITYSADPGATDDDQKWNYMILRPRGTFAPSHYVAYAGQRVAIGGDTTAVPITVAGALSTDIAIVQTFDADDDDCFVEGAVMTAGVLTLELTNDPVTEHSWSYLVLRAY